MLKVKHFLRGLFCIDLKSVSKKRHCDSQQLVCFTRLDSVIEIEAPDVRGKRDKQTAREGRTERCLFTFRRGGASGPAVWAAYTCSGRLTGSLNMLLWRPLVANRPTTQLLPQMDPQG